MPELLERIADRTFLHLQDVTEAIQDDIRSLNNSPDSGRLASELSAARHLNWGISAVVDMADQWRSRAQERLRVGMNGHDFRIMARRGETFSRLCLKGTELAGNLWNQMEAMGAPADDVREAREFLSAAKQRALAIEKWTDHLAKLAGREFPDIDPALIEQGAEEIRQGRFKTTSQILQSIRGTPS